MSVQSPALGAAPRRRSAVRVGAAAEPPAERPVVRIAAFAALGLYGVLRWGELMVTPPTGRLLGLLAIVLALGALGTLLGRRGRIPVALAALFVVLGGFALSGVPLAWVTHLRIAVTADAIGQGLSAIPRVLVPYAGANEWIRMAITLGAAVLLVDAGLLLSFAPAKLGDARRAAIALPLIALAVVPMTLLRPKHPYLHGLLLFGLIAAFMWGERVRRNELAWLLTAGALVAVAAMLLAPSLDRHKPWLNYQALAADLAPGHIDTFDWSQRYGPLNWPQTGREVLDVQAAHADYWKAENLETFNGRTWVLGGGTLTDPRAGVSADTLRRWTQTIHVTLRAMSTSTVIGSGIAEPPRGVSSAVATGASPGTWVTAGALGPGDSYAIKTYTPRPSAAELAGAGADYPNNELYPYRTIELPASGSMGSPFPVVFPPFHSAGTVQSAVMIGGQRGAAVVNGSPYGRAFALASRLAARAATPYAFVAGVERYLSRGFTYDESPPPSPYPLDSFLFRDRLGYCQQFAGAMALLLRMGGIPARVAAGFTSGAYNSSTHRWVVSDIDAHAWVEAWFPHYGWVGFDPTPGAAPARGGHSPVAAGAQLGNPGRAFQPPAIRRDNLFSSGTGATARRSGRSGSPLVIVAAIVLLAVLAVGATLLARRSVPPGEEMVAELERALARSGRPVTPGLTLAAIEHRFRGSPEAAAYVRAIRLARYAGTGAAAPSAAHRRALRGELSSGLGLAGAVRALWALPPRRPTRKSASRARHGA